MRSTAFSQIVKWSMTLKRLGTISSHLFRIMRHWQKEVDKCHLDLYFLFMRPTENAWDRGRHLPVTPVARHNFLLVIVVVQGGNMSSLNFLTCVHQLSSRLADWVNRNFGSPSDVLHKTIPCCRFRESDSGRNVRCGKGVVNRKNFLHPGSWFSEESRLLFSPDPDIYKRQYQTLQQ